MIIHSVENVGYDLKGSGHINVNRITPDTEFLLISIKAVFLFSSYNLTMLCTLQIEEMLNSFQREALPFQRDIWLVSVSGNF